MSKPKPHAARFKGKHLPDGRPAVHLGDYGIPPEHLDEEAIKALTPQQVAILRQHPDLYELTEAPEPKAAKSAPAKRTAKADDPPAPEPVDDTEADAPTGSPVDPEEKGIG